jgi:hypothetical protein
LPNANQVPPEWGRLVTVSEANPAGNDYLLWFQDDSGTVRLVGYNRVSRHLWPTASIIRRR